MTVQPTPGAKMISTLTGLETVTVVSGSVVAECTTQDIANVFGQAGENVVFTPTRTTDAYDYGVQIQGASVFFTGGASQKSYLLELEGNRPVGSAATGDSNDALIRATANNYAVNDANFILRGVNVGVTNRGGGVLGILDNSLSTANRVGGTVTSQYALSVRSENYGTVSDLFGGIDVNLTNEAAVATTEFGIRIRNTNNSITGPVTSAIAITKSGVNTGFTYALDSLGTPLTAAVLRVADDSVAADAAGGTVGSAVGGAFIRVLVGSTPLKIQLYADS